MRHVFVITFIGLIAFSGARALEKQDPLAPKKEAWQKALDGEKYRFSESNANLKYSLSQYRSECKINVVTGAKHWWHRILKFERDGKEILAIDGHTLSVFRAVDNTLYFAEFPPWTYGCKVIAFDLTTGKKMWETKLRAAGIVAIHSAYLNQLTMHLSSSKELEKEGEGAIVITGNESFGDYIEVLDRRTGALLAHKVYR